MATVKSAHWKKALALTLVLMAGLLFWLPASGASTWMAGGDPAPSVGGPPAMPAEYGGIIRVRGVLVPDGKPVTAKVEGNSSYTAAAVLTKQNHYTGLLVQPGGAYLGKTVTFYVDGELANETDTYAEGSIKTSFNLTVGVGPGTPTVTPTPAATATPTPTPTPPLASNQIKLEKGWNLISVRTPLQDPSVGTVFGALADGAKVFQQQGEGWLFAKRVDGTWGGTLTQVVDGVGYWVGVDVAATITLTPKSGPPALPPSYSLPAGDSFIGFTSNYAARPVDGYLSSLSGKWAKIRRFNATSQSWELAGPGGMGSFTQMEAGRGYSINMTEAGTLTP